jgi:hypothetical protein
MRGVRIHYLARAAYISSTTSLTLYVLMPPLADADADDVVSIGTVESFSSGSDLDSREPVSIPDAKVVEGPVHHRAFYLEDEHIKLQAGNTVFRIHSFFFTRESDEARAVVQQALSTEDRILQLDDVSSEDVERFCEVLYCKCVPSHSTTLRLLMVM